MLEVTQNPPRACLEKLVMKGFSTEISFANAKIEFGIALIPKKTNVITFFVRMESNPGQCSFTLDDTFFPSAHGGKRFINCVWVRLLPMGPRDHMQEGSYLMCSLCCLWGVRKTWRYGWGCCLWGQESTYHRGQFYASCEWVDPLTGLCVSVVYLW